jgi:hypothetical protein
MSRHNELPPVPPANRSTNGTGDQTKIDKDTAGDHDARYNVVEQGATAIEQNTTNGGAFHGRRVK